MNLIPGFSLFSSQVLSDLTFLEDPKKHTGGRNAICISLCKAGSFLNIVRTPSARRFPEGIPRGPPGLMEQTWTPVFTALPGGFQPVSASGMSLSRVQSIIVG